LYWSGPRQTKRRLTMPVFHLGTNRSRPGEFPCQRRGAPLQWRWSRPAMPAPAEGAPCEAGTACGMRPSSPRSSSQGALTDPRRDQIFSFRKNICIRWLKSLFTFNITPIIAENNFPTNLHQSTQTIFKNRLENTSYCRRTTEQPTARERSAAVMCSYCEMRRGTIRGTWQAPSPGFAPIF